MKTINDFTDIIDTILDYSDNHILTVEFKRKDGGEIYISVQDGFGEIVIVQEISGDKAIQSMMKECENWIDDQDAIVDEEDENET